MSIKSILVHLDATHRSAARLELAREIGTRFESAVTGLFALTPYALTVPQLYSSAALVMLQEVDEKHRESARAIFEASGRTTGCEVSWAELKGFSPTGCFVEQSRYADLLVLGQSDPHAELSECIPDDFVQSVLLQSGRPALILPYATPAKAKPSRVLIAWNGSSESAHAVTASLPLIRHASEVRVLCWGTEQASVVGGALDIKRYLSLHGIDARVDVSTDRDVDVGNTLLNAVSDCSTDLLVMGCYGHSRAREWILGGATRTVLRSMTVPVLMCH